MNKFKKLLLITSIALASMGANAELISTDWKTTGDNLVTLDTETGIEWLDLTQTIGMSINEVEGLLNSTFEGWRLPTVSEVTQMMMTAFSSQVEAVQATGSWSVTSASVDNEADNFMALFGTTYASGTYDYSLGLIKNDVVDATHSALTSGSMDRASDDYLILFSNSNTSSDLDYASELSGVFLVSDGSETPPQNVPVSAAFSLLGLGLIGFRRKQK